MAGTASAESTSLINAERNDFSSLNAPPAAAAANSTQTHSAPIKLVLLLGTGARATLLTESSASIDQIKSDLCQDWPVDFGERIEKKSRLRILHQGKFVDDAKTLQELGISSGSIVHLHIRPSSAKLAHQAEEDKQLFKTNSSSSCCCTLA